jgi:CRP-like cAMP-binding protein
MIARMKQPIEATWSLQHETVVALLDSVDWFASLTREELEGLARKAHTAHWALGAVGFEEGDQGDCCYIIPSGSVKTLRRFPDGRRITLTRETRASPASPGQTVLRGPLALPQ